MPPIPAFPRGFRWGTATSAYQIEGAASEDGRGPSVWDTFCAEPGRIRDGHTGEVASDHYHRYAGDVALMAGLGIDAYRFSVSWPRVQPDGAGAINAKGLDFYERLVDALVDHGIAPAVTLFHWDLPQALEDNGGWLARDTAARFAEYAGVVADRLADRVSMWITLNEPYVHTFLGYGTGVHAPGHTLLLDALPVAHHLLLGHGLAVAALRDRGARAVALTNNYSPVQVASNDAADAVAAEAFDVLQNRLFTEPVLRGSYPDLSALGLSEMPGVADGDLGSISAPLDGLGVNYYNPTRIAAPDARGGLPYKPVDIGDVPHTAFGWPVVPDGLRELLVGLRDRYGDALPPVYITENGCSYDDAPGPDGTVDDPDRIDYLDGHIRAVHEAIEKGVDVRGYFVWSLMDNFEWAEGFHQRFGLVHVDFETQRRTPKASATWYRDMIGAQRSR